MWELVAASGILQDRQAFERVYDAAAGRGGNFGCCRWGGWVVGVCGWGAAAQCERGCCARTGHSMGGMKPRDACSVHSRGPRRQCAGLPNKLQEPCCSLEGFIQARMELLKEERGLRL